MLHYVLRLIDEMSFSVLDYYVSVLHEKSVNFIYSLYNLPIFSGKFGTA